MRNFHNPLKIRKRLFILAFSICMTVPLRFIFDHLLKPRFAAANTFKDCPNYFKDWFKLPSVNIV